MYVPVGVRYLEMMLTEVGGQAALRIGVDNKKAEKLQRQKKQSTSSSLQRSS